MRSTHDLLKITSFSCRQSDCYRRFNSVKSLYRHLASYHNSANVPLQNGVEDVPVEDALDQENHIHCDNVVDMIDDNISKEDVSYVMKLYSKLNMTRTDIDVIMSSTIDLIDAKVGRASNSLTRLNTEYKRIQEFQREELYVDSESIILGYNFNNMGVQTPICCQYISIITLFTLVLSSVNVLDVALDYMNTRNDYLSDLKDGSKFRNLGHSTLPFILFYDELETGNPLGSKKGVHKVGALYVSLRCFPSNYYSKLKNIYICALFPSKKTVNLNTLLEKLVSDINHLQSEGLSINGKRILFKFAGVTGDNLGLNEILGFVESFSANFSCRICKMHKREMKKTVLEDETLLRNKENYESDLNDNDASSTGIKSYSILNNIVDFHVTNNDIVDLMHDVAEGVANFGMCEILNYYVSNDLVSVNLLNNSLKYFDFAEKKNRPPIIKTINIAKKDLGFSASEMINYVLYFSLMIGPYVSQSCEVWGYYKVLRQLVNMLLFKSISSDMINHIKNLVSEHHSMYMRLFNCHLKPKHHNLIHYSRLISKMGPLTNFWAMRFESKHLESKFIAITSRCRINLCKSLIKRHVLNFASYLYFLRQSPLNVNVNKLGPVIDKKCNFSLKWVIYSDFKYSINCYVCIFGNDPLIPNFGRLNKIEVRDNLILFHLLPTETVCYNDHLCSYEVKDLPLRENVVNPNSVSKPLVHTVINFKHFVSNTDI